jgi:hypothetical protein
MRAVVGSLLLLASLLACDRRPVFRFTYDATWRMGASCDSPDLALSIESVEGVRVTAGERTWDLPSGRGEVVLPTPRGRTRLDVRAGELEGTVRVEPPARPAWFAAAASEDGGDSAEADWTAESELDRGDAGAGRVREPWHSHGRLDAKREAWSPFRACGVVEVTSNDTATRRTDDGFEWAILGPGDVVAFQGPVVNPQAEAAIATRSLENPRVEGELVLRTADAATSRLRFRGELHLDRVFRRVTTGPLAWAKRSASPSDAWAWIDSENPQVNVGRSGGLGSNRGIPLGDVAWIAVVERREVAAPRCGPYSGGQQTWVESYGESAVVTLREAATGRVVARQEFSAERECPESIQYLGGAGVRVGTAVDDADIETWIADAVQAAGP